MIAKLCICNVAMYRTYTYIATVGPGTKCTMDIHMYVHRYVRSMYCCTSALYIDKSI